MKEVVVKHPSSAWAEHIVMLQFKRCFQSCLFIHLRIYSSVQRDDICNVETSTLLYSETATTYVHHKERWVCFPHSLTQIYERSAISRIWWHKIVLVGQSLRFCLTLFLQDWHVFVGGNIRDIKIFQFKYLLSQDLR